MLPENWKETPLHTLTVKERPICYGVVQPGDHDPEGVQFIRGGDIQEGKIGSNLRTISNDVSTQYKRTLLNGGELVVALVGYVGETAVVPPTLAGANIARQVGLVALDKGVHRDYVYQFLRSPIGKDRLLRPTIGSAQQVINIADLKKINITLPPLPEQQKIATILSTWDRAIELTEKLIAATHRRKQALIQQLLTGKVRLPGFKGSWRHEKIGRFLEECSARVSASTAIPVYTASRAGLKPQEEYYGGRKVANDGDYGVVPDKCFVYRHMSDDEIFVFHINYTGGDIAVSKEYPVFRTSDLDSDFLLALLNHSPRFKAFARSQKAGGTRTRLYLSRLKTWKTDLPSLVEQQRIAEVLNSANKEIDLHNCMLAALKRQKRGLMQQLLTGKVRV